MNKGLTAAVLVWASFPLVCGAQVVDCVINPNSTVELGSPQDGVLEEVMVKRGDRVVKGQPVARLDSEMERMNARLAGLKANSDIVLRSGRFQADFRARELKRLKALLENQSVSTSVYEQAEIEHKLAALSVDSAQLEHQIAQAEHDRAQALVRRRTIRSPADGVVVSLNMSPGEYVHEQRPLMNIAAIDPLYVEAFLPVASYGGVTTGVTALVRPEAPIGGEYEATIAVVDQVFDAASRTFGVRLELPNTDLALPAGVRCTVEFDLPPVAVAAEQ
ncbi:hemolysin D [Marinobacterium nitratireducens]|uniref:Hemolysin D n=1 Tax=Marinobacterium nitratireducens TaxID=518897 RepID=A0A917ZCK2_9GAMM|nr:efflux RND transporter periplasmic adaptor subunit [Marinobacterium nitratireducens]GGO79222.1 hemolysin D [Marinobacterium nitratireducens]